MAEMNPEAAEALLESAFGDAPPPQPAPRVAPAPPLPEPTEDIDEITGEAAPIEDQGEVAEPEQEAADSGPEPEFEIEVDGKTEIVRGKEQVRELLQKGTDYQRKTEEIARAREAIVAAAQLTQAQGQFQQSVMSDISELQAIDKQLEQYNKVDWAAAIDTDFVSVMKLQEQRTALREARASKLAELNAKQQQFAQGQAEATQRMLAAEYSALVAKLPAWRNSEVAQTERAAIVKELRASGYQDAELSQLTDHRALLIARDAMKWRELQRNKGDKVKQVRDAPPVTRPGAVPSQTNVRAQFARDVKAFKQAGAKGNHRAQEAWLEKTLGNTFK